MAYILSCNLLCMFQGLMFLMNFGYHVLYFVLFWMAWFFEEIHGLVPRTLCLYCRSWARVMESSGSSSDSSPSNIGSHILRTLDDGHMGLGLSRSTRYRTLMGQKPHMLGKVNQGLFTHMMEDVVVEVTQESFRDEKQPSSPWTQHIEVLDITLLTWMSPSRV